MSEVAYQAASGALYLGLVRQMVDAALAAHDVIILHGAEPAPIVI
ncbi:hypothetical protein [Nonomuraea terrae]|nr:hypothetical protein [Nonomuraea terrae]